MAGVVVSCASLVIMSILLDVLPDLFQRYVCRGWIHDQRLRLLPSFQFCVLSIILKIYLQPQHNVVNLLAVLSLSRPRHILPFLHLSPMRAYAEQRRASARHGEHPLVYCTYLFSTPTTRFYELTAVFDPQLQRPRK